MADYFNNRRGDDRDFNRDRQSEGYSMRESNSFDKRYADNGRAGGFFDKTRGNNQRSSRIDDDRLNRQLPPIEPYGQTVPIYAQPQAPYQPQGAIPNAAMNQQVFSIGNVVIFSPKSYADVQTLIDHLRRHEPAIVDFAGVGDDSGQRILDFLSGAIYALGGSMQRISGTIFLLTPSGVSISAPGDITKSIEERRKNR